MLKSATALTTPTGHGIGIMAIDDIGYQDTGLGGIITASGFTGITLVVRKLTRFQRPAGRGRQQILREVDARFLTCDGDTLSASLLNGADEMPTKSSEF